MGESALEPEPEQDREPEPYEVARAIVLRQLDAAPKSRLQLQEKLDQRNVDPQVAAAVLDRFEEVRLIDDAQFARIAASARRSRTGRRTSRLRPKPAHSAALPLDQTRCTTRPATAAPRRPTRRP